jgi:glycosyltransferase involved in cell wall biosynthesis
MMKVAINCWALRNKQLDGIGYFTVNTVSRIIRNHPEVHFQILCDKNFTEDYFDFDNASKHRIFPSLRHPVLYVLYMELVVPFFLRKHRPDVFLSADGFLSFSSSCKQISLIYDINFEHRPKDLKLQNRLYFRWFFKRFVRKASRIATISEYSKMDIAGFYKIDSGRIDNVSCGINSKFHPLSFDEIERVRQQWSGGKPYFFFVGSMHPRKNIKRLIIAFNLFKKRTNSDWKLLLAGSILWQKSEIEETYASSEFREDIIFTGRLSEEDLQEVLGSAVALSFVPIFEGFGLPIVEAMQSGVPVICSNVTSMPEVAGEAAILIDPYKIEDICSGMQKIYAEPSLRNRLIELGNKQKLKFSWENSASLLWQTITKTVGEGKS